MTILDRTWQGLRFATIATKSALSAAGSRDFGKEFLQTFLNQVGPGLGPKLSQLLLTRAGIDPNTAVTKPTPLPIEEISKIILTRSPVLAMQIDEIASEGIRASLGQVHRATLKDGRRVAIKVQIPGAKESVEKQVKMFLAAAGVAKKAFDLDAYETFLLDTLLAELDYRKEGAAQTQFRHDLQPLRDIIVPDVDVRLSTGDILVQSWEDASPFQDAQKLGPEKRTDLARVLCHGVLFQLFTVGRFHNDWHAGNYGFRHSDEGMKLVIYDFGSVTRLSPHQHQALLSIVGSALAGNFEAVPTEMVAMGFNRDLVLPIAAKISRAVKAWLTPMMSDRWDPRDWNASEIFERELGEHRNVFRTAGPPWLLMLMRTLLGMSSAVATLETAVNMKAIWTRVLPDAKGQMPRPPGVLPSTLDAGAAQFLWVSVKDKREEIVNLQMPVRALENLENLIPDAALERIAEAGFDIIKIKAAALKKGFVPQEVFASDAGERHYRIWLA